VAQFQALKEVTYLLASPPHKYTLANILTPKSFERMQSMPNKEVTIR
jgi:hypothetical protein